MSTIFRDKSKAEELRARCAADDDDWTYTIDQIRPVAMAIPGTWTPGYRVGVYDEIGRFVGYL